ncbi:AAA family ATPase [Yinghuangia seranimata]|uniref:AAA family ATPase n=1 Tax=Yinghuangia seranimata TaxID=408067 RepID=UPI00248ADCF7|nr:LuxR family transcriptional regulator [Yinghuangia seranimata]MDI2130084.1 AAA family ATPase [Yinghuangia seranimata]
MSDALLHRDRELAAIDALFRTVENGSPAVAVVKGPRGIGKSALLREALRRLPARAVVLRARCHSAERDFAYGMVRQLFDRPPAGFPERTPGFAAGAEHNEFASAGLLERSAVLNPAAGEPAHAMLDQLFHTTRALAATAPVVIAVDDLGQADGPSLRWFTYITRRLDAAPVAVLATVGDAPDDADPADLAGLPYVRTLRPRPLCETCAAERVAAVFGRPLDSETAAACHWLSSGNPLILSELAERLAGDAGTAATPDLDTVLRVGSATLVDTAVTWVRDRSPETGELLDAFAVLGPGGDLDMCAVLTGRGGFAATEARGILRAAGLLEEEPPDRLRHAALRTELLARLNPAIRLELHEHAAELLSRLGAPARQTADHVMSLGSLGGSERAWAVPVLRAAAHDAASTADWNAAGRYLRRALAELPPGAGADTVELTRRLGAVELHRDLRSAVRALGAVVARTDDARELTQAVTALTGPGAVPVTSVESAEGARPFVVAAAGLGGVPDAPRELVLLTGAQALLAGHRVVDRRVARAVAGSGAESTGARAYLGVLAAGHAAAGRHPYRAMRLAGRCVAGGPTGVPDLGLLCAAAAFAWSGDPAEALRWCDPLVDGLRRRRHDTGLALALVVRADARARATGTDPDVTARWDESLDDAQEALELARDHGAPGIAAGAAAVAARILLTRPYPRGFWHGPEGAASPAADAAGAVLAGNPVPTDAHPLVRAMHLESRGLAVLAAGDPAAAAALFLECGHQLAVRGIEAEGCVPWRARVATAYKALGEHEAARAILADAPTQAADATDEPPPAAEAPSPQRPASARLTAGERRVTELVLQNLSNLEVAERLCLSKRTVDTHLGRVYRKLGIRGRPDLAAALEEL